MIEANAISYKDSAARVIKKDNVYYRYIFFEYKNEYDYLMSSGLYEDLINEKLLIEHQEIEINTTDSKVYKVLCPKQIPFQSLPFEWSYNSWKKAILTYLRINILSLKYGMILKDATPYNFIQNGGDAIMIDTSSFKFFKNNDSWTAYRQFCEEFLSPISLIYYKGSEWSKHTMPYINGLDLSFVSRQLPLKSWFELPILINIHLHSKFLTKRTLKNKRQSQNRGFTIDEISFFQKIIYKTIFKWSKINYNNNNLWYNYYESNFENTTYLQKKEQIIRTWLNEIKPKSVLDLGANTGKFSFIAAEYSNWVISLENEISCVEEIESQILNMKIRNVFTVIGNIVQPAPGLGILNKEISGLYKRINVDLVLVLAVIHHLYITNLLDFRQIGEILNCFDCKYLIVEFISREDLKVRDLLVNKNVNINSYNINEFITKISEWFYIKEIIHLNNTERSLILIQKK
jgi:hypothetical protein